MKNIDKTIAEILSVKQYENMVIHYHLRRIFLDRDYDVMVNQTLYVSFLKPVLDTGKFNQMVIVLLVRALANAINKEIWRSFLHCKHEYRVFVDKHKKMKESKAIEALKQAGKPATVQIAEQVDAHLKKAFKRAEKEDLKGSSKKQKSEQSEKKSQSSDRSFHREKAFSADRGRGRSQASRGRIYPSSQQRGQNPFDPYSIDKAPMFIFEYQVIPIKIHNISKKNYVCHWVQNSPL